MTGWRERWLPTTICIAFSGAANCFPGSQAAANALFGAQQSAAVQRADAVIASVFGGANPFLGQRVPSQEFANFGRSNPVRSGFGGWAADPTLQTVLGFSSGSNVNIGTAFLQNFNSAFSPFGGSGFGGFSLRAREPLMSAAPPVASLDDLNRRWQALAAREIDYYYSDANLSALRTESDTLSLVGSYGEPMYMYWTYELTSVAGQVQARAPSYSQWEAASQEVSSWTNPSDSVDLLAQRFARRQQVQKLAAKVQMEGLQIIQASTVLANNFLKVTQLLPQLLQQAASNDLLRASLSAWQARSGRSLIRALKPTVPCWRSVMAFSAIIPALRSTSS